MVRGAHRMTIGDDKEFPAPVDGIVLTHFVVSADVARSRDFYVDVLGGTPVMEGEPTIVKLANSWIIINVGGGPTEDKPEVVLDVPDDPNRSAPSSTSGLRTSRACTRSGRTRVRRS